VLVYPGPAQDLGAKANEFLADKKLPDDFDLVLDPDYKVTNLYGIRAGCASRDGLSIDISDRPAGNHLLQQEIVKEHGGRTSAAEILDALPKHKPAQ
jgi:hypothetical protein